MEVSTAESSQAGAEFNKVVVETISNPTASSATGSIRIRYHEMDNEFKNARTCVVPMLFDFGLPVVPRKSVAEVSTIGKL